MAQQIINTGPPGFADTFKEGADKINQMMAEIYGITSVQYHFEHLQATPASNWFVDHNLGLEPVVTVIDSSGYKIPESRFDQHNHPQGSPSTAWNVKHLFGNEPSITVKDSSGYIVQPSNIFHPDTMSSYITFASPVSGEAIALGYGSSGYNIRHYDGSSFYVNFPTPMTGKVVAVAGSGMSGYSGIAGPPAGSWVYTQSTPSSGWQLNHNLTVEPSVTIINSSGYVEHPKDIRHYNTNSAYVTFATDLTGKAVVAGGTGASGYSGVYGMSGYSGYSGISGYTGLSGYSGIAGTAVLNDFTSTYTGASTYQINHNWGNYPHVLCMDLSGYVFQPADILHHNTTSFTVNFTSVLGADIRVLG